MVQCDGPQCADTTAVAARESTAGQWFLIGDASLGWNPAGPTKEISGLFGLVRDHRTGDAPLRLLLPCIANFSAD
jgi:hypothetical protein